jgi:hypothetical protein
MIRFRGNLEEKFELNIKEEPDYAFQRDSKDDSLINNNIFDYQSQDGKFSSKSLSGLAKKFKKKTNMI